jgi:hypothetical protein
LVARCAYSVPRSPCCDAGRLRGPGRPRRRGKAASAAWPGPADPGRLRRRRQAARTPAGPADDDWLGGRQALEYAFDNDLYSAA